MICKKYEAEYKISKVKEFLKEKEKNPRLVLTH